MNELNIIKSDLEEIVGIIIKAKENAFRKVNEELIEMYWTIGKKLSENSQKTGYGDFPLPVSDCCCFRLQN